MSEEIKDFLLEKLKQPKNKKRKLKDIINPQPYPEALPPHPFRWLFSGASQSGKTTLMTSLLTKFYKDYFDRFILLSPNAHSEQWQKAIEEIGEDKVDVYTDWDEETEQEFLKILDEQKEDIEKDGIELADNICFIFDDKVDDKEFMNSEFLKMLIVRGRHGNVSSMFGTQYYNGFPLKLRKNLSAVCMFGTRNQKEIDALCQEYCHKDLTKEQFNMMFEYATRGDYKFITILPNHENSREMYRKGFCEVLRLKPLITSNLTPPISNIPPSSSIKKEEEENEEEEEKKEEEQKSKKSVPNKKRKITSDNE